MLRLLVLIIFYTLTVVSLPRFAPFAALLNAVAKLPGRTALVIVIGAFITSSFLLYIFMKRPNGLIYRHHSPLLLIIRTGLLGVILAALFDFFEATSGYAVTLSNIILIPLAFIAGETAYLAGLWLWHKIRRTPQPIKAPVDDIADTENTGGMPRLVITLPIYAFILVYLPQQQDFRNLEAKLVNVAPSAAFAISIAALIGAAMIGMYALNRAETKPLPYTGDPVTDAKTEHFAKIKLSLVLSLVIGLGIAALVNIVGYFISYAPSLMLLIIMPLGFTVAEAVYEALNWRLKHGPA